MTKDAFKTYIASNGQEFIFSNGVDYGYGYLASVSGDDVYDENYFQSYVERAKTEMGEKLNQTRMELCDIEIKDSDSICDVGIGGGAFVSKYTGQGFDVNPHAVQWLKENNYYANPYEFEFDYLTMWDVIEHIDNVKPLLNNVRKGVVISTPIYKDFYDVINSKHFKPNEHLWYFTDYGIRNYMRLFGFECVHADTRETDLGRESIGSYIFRKKAKYISL